MFAVFYTDAFLLWLLYRFVRPQPTQRNGNSIASATLFAHDPSSASENLKHAYNQSLDEKQAQNRKDQANKFLAFVIKEWQDDIRTESAIGFEFLDASARCTPE